MMNCLIVDDNEIARTTLRYLAEQVRDLEIMDECSNAIEAYNYLQSNTVDLLFLDIEMPGMSGLELTQNIAGSDIIIIFTTSRAEYAVKAFELSVADYLVKPYTTARFLQTIDRARDIFDTKTKSLPVRNEEFIFVRDSSITRRLNLDDIFYAEAMGDYVKFHTRDKLYAVHGTMKSATEKLPPTKFIRIHRSYIVSIDKIDTLQEGGLVINGTFLAVANAYKKALYRIMNIF